MGGSNAVIAKVRVNYGNRITADDYAEMSRKRSIAEVAGYLKSHPSYAKILADVQEGSVHREHLENMIKQGRFMSFERMLRYELGNEDGLFGFITVEAEIEILLRAIRCISSGRTAELPVALPFYLEGKLSFSLGGIGSVKSFDDFLSAIDGTVYHKLLERFRPPLSERINYEGCEWALMSYYYELLMGKIEKRKGTAADELKTLFSLTAETSNLMTIYRLKRFYHKTPAQIRERILPYCAKINKHRLDALISAKEDGEFLNLLGETAYGVRNLVNERHSSNMILRDVSSRDAAPVGVMSRRCKRLQALFARKRLRFSTSSEVVFAAYTVLKTIEVENITAIIECVRYNLPAAQWIVDID